MSFVIKTEHGTYFFTGGSKCKHITPINWVHTVDDATKFDTVAQAFQALHERLPGILVPFSIERVE